MTCEIRRVRTAGERTAVHRLRYDVYIRELANDHPRADHDRGELADDLDGRNPVILGAFVHGELAGTLRLNALADCPPETLTYHQIGPEEWAEADRRVVAGMLVVAPAHRGRPVMVRLAKAATDHIRDRGGHAFHLFGERHNARLYERMGFRVGWDRPMRHPVYREVFPCTLDVARQPAGHFYRRVLRPGEVAPG